jgi:hypothetical protein
MILTFGINTFRLAERIDFPFWPSQHNSFMILKTVPKGKNKINLCVLCASVVNILKLKVFNAHEQIRAGHRSQALR